ncbi:hypothetical protein SKAU_G00198280 [Synaphobranchus kaupii]|uniref:Chemokine interleukin-8-like domain-containing protein n=1 Tax=Synaphobranchus kaupii TaxID=118154 RepID=A0A9Q1FF13_SYNKA|nr:hypothetical protein SKAU_G00198280 [Synaphobranchus kaupii]
MHHIWKCIILAMLLASGITAQRFNFRRPMKVTTICCKSVSKAHFTFKVTGYKQQNALGRCVDAIIFYTEKGKVCSNPEDHWVQMKMKEVPRIP